MANDDDARLERIEKKVDRLAEGMERMARIEERLAAALDRYERLEERQANLEKRVTVLETDRNQATPFLSMIKGGVMAAIGAVVAIFIGRHI